MVTHATSADASAPDMPTKAIHRRYEHVKGVHEDGQGAQAVGGQATAKANNADMLASQLQEEQ